MRRYGRVVKRNGERKNRHIWVSTRPANATAAATDMLLDILRQTSKKPLAVTAPHIIILYTICTRPVFFHPNDDLYDNILIVIMMISAWRN